MNTSVSNGSDRGSHGVVVNLAHFLRDLVALFELQGLLLTVEARDEFRKARIGLLLIFALTSVGLSCLPLGLAGVALFIAESTRLSIGESLLWVALAGFSVAGVGIYSALQWTRPGSESFRRSRDEWKCNMTWMKETLKHAGDYPPGDRSRLRPDRARQ